MNGPALALHEIDLVVPDGDEQLTILDRVSCSVSAGEVLAVSGPSGSGKSSLLAVAAGLRRPTSGRVVVAGVDLAAARDSERVAVRRRHIGVVFQGANLVEALTAREQLLLAAHISGRVTAEHRRRADALLEQVGLTGRADRRPHQLSGGERQRVGLARALMTKPSVLLADEPTSALDHVRASELTRLLVSLSHDEGVATMVVSHDERVVSAADRVVRLDEGRLLEPPASMSGGRA